MERVMGIERGRPAHSVRAGRFARGAHVGSVRGLRSQPRSAPVPPRSWLRSDQIETLERVMGIEPTTFSLGS